MNMSHVCDSETNCSCCILIQHVTNHEKFIVFQMEFDKTRWSCPWNSDQNCTQNSSRGGRGEGVWGGMSRGGGGLVVVGSRGGEGLGRWGSMGGGGLGEVRV